MNESITVKCPSCSHAFPLSEGVLSSVREGVSRELQGDIAEREKALEARQQAIRDEQAGLKQQKADLQEQIDAQVETQIRKREGEIRAKAEEKAQKQASENQAVAMKALEEERDEKAAALKKAQTDQLALLAEKRQLQEAKDQLEIESRRKFDEEREQLREQLQKQADESSRLKIAEKEKIISDLGTKLQEAQRKAEQGSMQTQGEVLELDFEQQLRQIFPLDQVDPVATGARGADIRQEVVSRIGRRCGIILVETKRTKAWQDAWTGKLRSDMQGERADIGLIITEALPKGIDHFGEKDGVWVADFASAIPLMHVLRATLQEVSLAKGLREGAKEKMEMIYEYLTGNEFRQRVQLVIVSFRSMKVELDKERSYLSTKWNKREKQINLVIENMAGMVGDVQALSGGAVQSLPLLDGEDEEDVFENEADGEVAA